MIFYRKDKYFHFYIIRHNIVMYIICIYIYTVHTLTEWRAEKNRCDVQLGEDYTRRVRMAFD